MKPSAKKPATSKDKEWGVVGKAMGLAKTTMLQRMGKVGITQATPAMKADNKQVKQLIRQYDELIKATKRTCLKTTEYTASIVALCEATKTLADFFNGNAIGGAEVGGDIHGLGSALSKLGSIPKETSRMRDILQSEIYAKLAVPSELFVQGPMETAREAKRRFSKARLEYDAADGKLRACRAQNTPQSWGGDAQRLFLAHSHYWTYRRRYIAREHEAQMQLGDIVVKNQIELLEYLVGALNAQYDYYSEAYTILYDLDPFLRTLQSHVDQRRRELEENKARRQLDASKALAQMQMTKYDPLVQLLSAPDLAVVNALCVCAGADQDVILEDLVRILDAHKQTMPIIRLGISKEVESTQSAQTLFRGNSTATKLMTAFTRMTGRPYLISTLKPIVSQILPDPTGYEVDPAKLKPGENIEDNTAKLQKGCELFLKAIIDSLPVCPLPFREMAGHLQAEVVTRFPESRFTAVGGFIFLRFFCPCILSPDVNGLADPSSLDQDARRSLTLVSKSLQNLSNGIQFGAKELFMGCMNQFINGNMDICKNFLDSVAQVPPNVRDYVPLASLEEVRAKELPSTHKILVKNMEKICKSLTQYNEQAVIPKLIEVLGELGDPE